MAMKKETMKSLLATALSIFAVAVSCMASDKAKRERKGKVN